MDYLLLSPEDRAKMCSRIGIQSADDLFKVIPDNLRLQNSPDLPAGRTEQEIRDYVLSCTELNRAKPNGQISFLGGGAYDHFIPSAIDSLVSRGEFLTAYTPYQAEISQGLLQSIWEYQELMCRITGMEVSNASLYEGGTALVESLIMSKEITRRKGAVIAGPVNPEWIKVMETYNQSGKFDITFTKEQNGCTDIKNLEKALDNEPGCCVVQYPNWYGQIDDIPAIREMTRKKNVLLIVVFYPMAAGLYARPGDLGADITTGEAQCFGIPLSYGGPYLGYVACRKKHIRSLPGRIAGRTEDKNGQTAYVLTLQTREQHIRREKAYSNICSNEALCALRASIYLSLMGDQGLTDTAQACFEQGHSLYEKLKDIKGITLPHGNNFFNEFLVQFKDRPQRDRTVLSLQEQNIYAGIPEGESGLLMACTEKTRSGDIEKFIQVLKEELV